MSADHAAERTAHPKSTAPEGAKGTAEASRGRGKVSAGLVVKRLLQVAAVVALIFAVVKYGVPAFRRAMTTVSTDDAYVNGHVTYLAPRIGETVVEVRADDNDYVRKGELIVVLDKAVETIRVEEDQAALDVAHRALEQQIATARASAASAKANRYKLASAISGVKNQIATLRSTIAVLREREAEEKLAKLEADRYRRLAEKNSVPQEQADVRITQYEEARASVRETLEKIHSLRAALELPEIPPPGKPLDDVPPDLDQRHSSVQSALGAFALNLAELGQELPRYTETPDQFIERILKMAPNGDIDKLIEQTVNKAPGAESARAEIERAEKNLAMSKLQLSYCEVRADIDGYVSNRNVNVGDRVAQNQRLMAIRSYTEIWIDANFKETQLDPIRIGHPVDMYVDAYPGKVFKGRVQGFSPGTGASLSLLPPQNATGNYVKIVQRLPVRVELVGENPPDTPLFIGLSVVPYVKISERPTGPNADQRLRRTLPAMPEKSPATSAHPST